VSISSVVLNDDDNGQYDVWGPAVGQLACLHGGQTVHMPSTVMVDNFDYRLLPLFDQLRAAISSESHSRSRRRPGQRSDQGALEAVHWTLPYVSPVNRRPVITASLPVYSNLTGRSLFQSFTCPWFGGDGGELEIGPDHWTHFKNEW